MRAGGFQHLVLFDEPVVVRTPAGGEILNWTPTRKAFAAIQPQSGTERAEDGGVVVSLTSKITVRWTPWIEGITAKWRIRHRIAGAERIYNIQSIGSPDTARRDVVFVCTGGANAG